MKWIGLALACVAGTSTAQTMTPVDDADGVAVLIRNNYTMRVEVVSTAKTAAGPVTVRYVSTPNGGPNNPADSFEVIEVPSGHVAIPASATLAEGDVVRVEIIEFAGM